MIVRTFLTLLLGIGIASCGNLPQTEDARTSQVNLYGMYQYMYQGSGKGYLTPGKIFWVKSHGSFSGALKACFTHRDGLKKTHKSGQCKFTVHPLG